LDILLLLFYKLELLGVLVVNVALAASVYTGGRC